MNWFMRHIIHLTAYATMDELIEVLKEEAPDTTYTARRIIRSHQLRTLGEVP